MEWSKGISCDECIHKRLCVIRAANGPFHVCYEGTEINKNVMSPDEFRDMMLAASKREIHIPNMGIHHKHDVEGSHSAMDGLMCELLRSLGYSEGVDIFCKTNKWYA